MRISAKATIGPMPSSYQRLIVPVNGTGGDARVLALVGEILHQHNAAVTLIYVVEVQQSMPLDAELPAEIDRGEAILRRAEDLAKTAIGHKIDRLTTDLLQARSAGSAIVDEAIERNANAIVMASTLRNKHGKLSLGETSGYVIKNAPCEVVVVRLAIQD
jgi:nucleotide-binding universal stress UspA family protein